MSFNSDARERQSWAPAAVGSMRAETEVRKGASPDQRPAIDRLRVAEIYASRQGEGRWTGAPSVFLRTSGCNLRCWFCDTPFASWHPEGDSLTVDEVLARTLAFREADVVITGGEPLLFPSIGEICKRLRAAGRRVTIETAGTIDQVFECDLLSVSPKLSSSAPDASAHPRWHATHHARRQQIDLVRRWTQQVDYQLKFVVSDLADAAEVLDYLEQLGSVDPDRVWMMPEGTSMDVLESRAAWLVPWCTQHGFHYCPRSHIAWYGNRRAT